MGLSGHCTISGTYKSHYKSCFLAFMLNFMWHSIGISISSRTCDLHIEEAKVESRQDLRIQIARILVGSKLRRMVLRIITFLLSIATGLLNYNEYTIKFYGV